MTDLVSADAVTVDAVDAADSVVGLSSARASSVLEPGAERKIADFGPSGPRVDDSIADSVSADSIAVMTGAEDTAERKAVTGDVGAVDGADMNGADGADGADIVTGGDTATVGQIDSDSGQFVWTTWAFCAPYFANNSSMLMYDLVDATEAVDDDTDGADELTDDALDTEMDRRCLGR